MDTNPVSVSDSDSDVSDDDDNGIEADSGVVDTAAPNPASSSTNSSAPETIQTIQDKTKKIEERISELNNGLIERALEGAAKSGDFTEFDNLESEHKDLKSELKKLTELKYEVFLRTAATTSSSVSKTPIATNTENNSSVPETITNNSISLSTQIEIKELEISEHEKKLEAINQRLKDLCGDSMNGLIDQEWRINGDSSKKLDLDDDRKRKEQDRLREITTIDQLRKKLEHLKTSSLANQ